MVSPSRHQPATCVPFSAGVAKLEEAGVQARPHFLAKISRFYYFYPLFPNESAMKDHFPFVRISKALKMMLYLAEISRIMCLSTTNVPDFSKQTPSFGKLF